MAIKAVATAPQIIPGLMPSGAELSDEQRVKLAANAGKGVSQAAEDNLIPLVYILNDKSKYCKRTGADYVEGAEPGMIMLRNADRPLVPGAEGILFQPCFFIKDFGEWVPRAAGGGLIARHPTAGIKTDDEGNITLSDGRIAKKGVDERNPRKPVWRLPNGNELVETRNHIGHVLTPNGPVAYVLPMTGTLHTVSKNWMVQMNNKVINSKVAPSYAVVYKLALKEKANPQGTWFIWDVKEAGWADAQLADRGETLYNSCASGAKQMAAMEEHIDADDGDTTGAM